MRYLLAGAAMCLAAGCATIEGEPAGQDVASAAEAVQQDVAIAGAMNAAFAELGEGYLEAYAALNPVGATQLGNHAHDGRLPDITAEGRATQLSVAKALLEALEDIDPDALTRDNQVDYALLENALNYEIWATEDLREWAWNPQYYNDIASYSLYGLVARDFAPWPQRFESIVERMEQMPAFLAEARVQIDVARVPQVHAETVAKQNAGIMAIIDAALLPEIEAQGSERGRFDVAYADLKAAIAEHQTWLDTEVVPGAQGEFRLGAEKYDRKMAFALQSTISRQELKAKAVNAFEEIRAQMQVVARTFPDCVGQSGTDGPVVQQEEILCALEKTYANRATRTSLEDAARKTLADATAFTREQGFVRMPDGGVQIITMPKFWQGNAVAYLDAPAPLEKHLPAFYAVSPVPESWTDEQATSFLKEYNISMLHLLSIHEGVPGHYLQLDHANKNDSTLRGVLQSGPFIEGWAVYSEKVMADEGYLGGMETEAGRLMILSGLKFRLRAVANTLLDIGIHTEGMTREEAMELMMEGAFQQEREAAGKWVRANLSSVQLLSYYTGFEEHLALRKEAEQRWGEAFDQRKYHDQVLSYGSPPAKYVRQLMFGK